MAGPWKKDPGALLLLLLLLVLPLTDGKTEKASAVMVFTSLFMDTATAVQNTPNRGAATVDFVDAILCHMLL
eukprot:jgi/Psemu1/308444/fgenesh1_kg.412_\